MKFEELSGIWNSADMELEKSVKINKQLVKELGLAKVKSRLYEIKWTSIIEIGVNAIFLSFLTGFIFDHFSDFKFSIPAFILLVVTVVSLAISDSTTGSGGPAFGMLAGLPMVLASFLVFLQWLPTVKSPRPPPLFVLKPPG